MPRVGLEFRNDLLGHIHGLGLAGVPSVWHDDACAEMHALGATTTYAHPFSPLTGGYIGPLFGAARTVVARELVADAVLGLVDSVEGVSCFDDRGAVVLYHQLLSCGLRLTATAGTVRSGRIVVTNGHWLTLRCRWAQPGSRARPLARRPAGGTRPRDWLRRRPAGAARAGRRARRDRGNVLKHEITVRNDGLWLAAAAYGGEDHTPSVHLCSRTQSPVYADVAGRRVARLGAAR